MKTADTLPPLKGMVVFDIINAHTGEIIEHYEDKNLVVNNGRQSVTKLLADSLSSNKRLTKLGVGTNGTAPTGADTALTGSFVKLLSGFSYPTASSVRFTWTLGADEANGIAIREFGLISSDNTLFARKVREVINKNADIILSGYWQISF